MLLQGINCLTILLLNFFSFANTSEEFNAGFGSHTPMLLGQAKVVRYYPYYQRLCETHHLLLTIFGYL
jgi:hypothetical protein